MKIREDARPNSIVAAFYAIDDDLGTNSRISYSLRGDQQADFHVDAAFGWLQIGARGLDYNRRRGYNLTLVAEDGGGLRAEQNFEVFVADVNNRAPTFERDTYELLRVDAARAELSQPLLRLKINVCRCRKINVKIRLQTFSG